MIPVRIQRRRTKGWRMPPDTVYVGRPTIYGNLFRGVDAVTQFRLWWLNRGRGSYLYPDEMALLMGALFQTEPHPLRGKNLACWCRVCPAHQDGKPLGVVCADCTPCHADVLLEIANA